MIGGFRQWDDIDDPRRSRGPAPQEQNIVGLPAAQGALVRAEAANELVLTDDGEFISKRSAYGQSGGTDRSLYERLAANQRDDGLRSSNIGKLIRG